VNPRLILVVTLCLALGLAGFLSPSSELPPAKACACGHGPASAPPHLPGAPCADGCPICGGPCLASLPESDGFAIVLDVSFRRGDVDSSGDALTYPPPLPPPRAPAPFPSIPT